MSSIHVFVTDVRHPAGASAYLQSRFHGSVHQPSLIIEPETLNPPRSEPGLTQSLSSRVRARLGDPLGKDQVGALQANAECARTDVGRIAPLYAGEDLESDAFHRLPEDVGPYSAGTPVLIRRTRFATFVALFMDWRLGQSGKRLAPIVDPASIPPSPLFFGLVEDIVNTSVTISQQLSDEGDPLGPVKALGTFAGFLSGLASPQQEPLTVQIKRLFQQTLNQAFLDQFNADLTTRVSYFKTNYFPRLKARDKLTPSELNDHYEKLDQNFIKVLELRNRSAGGGIAEVGFPTYLSCQNFLTLILDQMAIYDPVTTDRFKSTNYTVTLPDSIDTSKFHIDKILPVLRKQRTDHVKVEESYLYGGRNNTIYLYAIEDEFTSFSTGKSTDKRLVESVFQNYKQLAADEQYERLQIAQEIRAWDALLGKDWPGPILERKWVELTPQDAVYVSKGAGATHGDIHLFNVPSSKIPPGFHAVGTLAGVNGLPRNARLLLVKENEPGALLPPEKFTRVWSSEGIDGGSRGSVWRPHAPRGYVALGDVGAGRISGAPDRNAFRCVRSDLVLQTALRFLWNDQKSGADDSVTLFQVAPYAPFPSGCFVSSPFLNQDNDSWGDPINYSYQLKAERVPIERVEPTSR